MKTKLLTILIQPKLDTAYGKKQSRIIPSVLILLNLNL
jgi:hypothetical protein